MQQPAVNKQQAMQYDAGLHNILHERQYSRGLRGDTQDLKLAAFIRRFHTSTVC